MNGVLVLPSSVLHDVFSMGITNTCEKRGMPLGARHTGMPLAVPQV